MTWKEKYMRDPNLAESIIQALRRDLRESEKRVEMLTFALERIRDCDCLPINKLREIAEEALQ